MNFTDHFARVKDAINNVYGIHNLAPWIEKHTYLDGKRFLLIHTSSRKR